MKRAPTCPGRRAAGSRWLGARLADGPRHPVPGMPTATPPTARRPRPVARAAAAFPAGVHPERRRGAAVRIPASPARSRGAAALEALARLGDRIAPVLQIAEIRTIAADDLWMSPALRARHGRLPLHLDPGRRGRDAGRSPPIEERARARSPPGRTGASCSARRPAVTAPVPAVADFAGPAAAVRPGREVPQRIHRPLLPGGLLNPVTGAPGSRPRMGLAVSNT